MTSVLFGASATQILGDLGADVIKVEAPPREDAPGGDILRWGGRPANSPGMGPLFMAYNRNKRSVVLDLDLAEQAEALRAMLRRADLLVTNIRRPSLERLGFGYPAVRELNPAIVYVHCDGFGSEGPYADLAAYDDLIQAAAASADLLPRVLGDAVPRYLPGLVADKTAALHAAYAAMAALFHRERTGRGQLVEVPMLECFVSFTMSENLYGEVFEPPTGEVGYPRVLNPNRRPFRTKDGYVAIVPYSDRQWETFFELAGQGDVYRTDPLLSDYATRTAHSAEVYELAARAAASKTTEEWLDVLSRHDIPAMRVNRLDDVVDDPHLAATGFFERRRHPTEGVYRSMRHPVRFTESPASVRRDPPLLGEHTAEILSEAEAL